MQKSTLTPFLILLPAGLFICLYYALFYLFIETGGGLKEAGLLLFSLSIGFAALLIVERMFVYRNRQRLRQVWIAESAILFLFALFYYNRRAAFYYKVSDDTKWFAVFLSEEHTQRKSSYAFPFNRVVHIDSNEVVQISRKDIDGKRQAVRASGHKWRGYSWRCKRVTVDGKKIELAIYCRPRTELTATDYEQMEVALLRQVRNQKE